MLMQLTREQRSSLPNPYVGVATTVRPDGTPHSTVVSSSGSSRSRSIRTGST